MIQTTDTSTDSLNIFTLLNQKGGNVPQPGQTFYIPNQVSTFLEILVMKFIQTIIYRRYLNL